MTILFEVIKDSLNLLTEASCQLVLISKVTACNFHVRFLFWFWFIFVGMKLFLSLYKENFSNKFLFLSVVCFLYYVLNNSDHGAYSFYIKRFCRNFNSRWWDYCLGSVVLQQSKLFHLLNHQVRSRNGTIKNHLLLKFGCVELISKLSEHIEAELMSLSIWGVL